MTPCKISYMHLNVSRVSAVRLENLTINWVSQARSVTRTSTPTYCANLKYNRLFMRFLEQTNCNRKRCIPVISEWWLWWVNGVNGIRFPKKKGFRWFPSFRKPGTEKSIKIWYNSGTYLSAVVKSVEKHVQLLYGTVRVTYVGQVARVGPRKLYFHCPAAAAQQFSSYAWLCLQLQFLPPKP